MKKIRLFLFSLLICILSSSCVYAEDKEVDDEWMSNWIDNFGNKSALGKGEDHIILGYENDSTAVKNGFDKHYEVSLDDANDGFLLHIIGNRKGYSDNDIMVYFTHNPNPTRTLHNRAVGNGTTSKSIFTSPSKGLPGYIAQCDPTGTDRSWFNKLGTFYTFATASSPSSTIWYCEPDFTIDYTKGESSVDLYNWLVKYKGKKPSIVKSPYFYLKSSDPVPMTNILGIADPDKKQIQYILSWKLPEDWPAKNKLRVIISTSTRENGTELCSLSDNIYLNQNTFYSFFLRDDVVNAILDKDTSWRPVPSAMFNVYVSGSFNDNGANGSFNASDSQAMTTWTRFTCYCDGRIGNAQGQDISGNPTEEFKEEKGDKYSDGTETDSRGGASSSTSTYNPEKDRNTSSTGSQDTYSYNYSSGESDKLNISKNDFESIISTLKDCANFIQSVVSIFTATLNFLPPYIKALMYVGIALFIVLGMLKAIRG